jgi:hypothetical protein
MKTNIIAQFDFRVLIIRFEELIDIYQFQLSFQ